jgi:hypothetical protein
MIGWQDKLLRNAVLDRWVDHATWDWSYHPGGGGITNQLYIRAHREVIRQYIKNYHPEHGRLPRNTHHIRMSYAPDGTADYLFIARWGGGVINMRGMVDMDVTFPPGPLPPVPEPEPSESRIEQSGRHDGSACRFCNPDRELIFLESSYIRGLWSAAGEAPATTYLFTRRPIADWFGATREEQMALIRSIDLVRDAVEDRLRSHDRTVPTGYSVAFATGSLRGDEHLYLDVRPEYPQGPLAKLMAAIRGGT